MYSDRVMALFRGAIHAGSAAGETHRGVGGVPGCGPSIVLSLRVEEGVVREARFQTYGCPVAMACAEVACSFIEGGPLERIRDITAADVRLCIGGVPEGKEHIPPLAAQALARVAPVETPAALAER